MRILKVRAVEGRMVARERVSPPQFLGVSQAVRGGARVPSWDTAAVFEVPATHYYVTAVRRGDLVEAAASAPAPAPPSEAVPPDPPAPAPLGESSPTEEVLS